MFKYFLPIYSSFFISLVVSFEKHFNFDDEVKFIKFYFMSFLSKNFGLSQN